MSEEKVKCPKCGCQYPSIPSSIREAHISLVKEYKKYLTHAVRDMVQIILEYMSLEGTTFEKTDFDLKESLENLEKNLAKKVSELGQMLKELGAE